MEFTKLPTDSTVFRRLLDWEKIPGLPADMDFMLFR